MDLNLTSGRRKPFYASIKTPNLKQNKFIVPKKVNNSETKCSATPRFIKTIPPIPNAMGSTITYGTTNYYALPGAPLPPEKVLSKFNYLLTSTEALEIKTYPDIYYIRQNQPQKSKLISLRQDFFEFQDGDHIRFRYQQMSEIGRGAFGSVIKCYDHKDHKIVALKLVKDTPKMQTQTLSELNTLERLQENPNFDTFNIIKLIDCFKFHGFYVFVFELLGCDLYQTLHWNANKGLPIEQIKTVASNILQALKICHENGIIHCDVRPQNILWSSFRRTQAKLIDFGCAKKVGEKEILYIQSRNYRAPEVIFGQTISPAVDIWSLGCVIAEIATGVVLFDGSNEEEQISLYIQSLGLPPKELLTNSQIKPRLDHNVIPNLKAKLRGIPENLCDFIASCLVWDPKSRPTASDMLTHKFLS